MDLPFTKEQIETVVSTYPKLAAPVLQPWVMAQYGATMLQVQAFELRLAGLVLTAWARDRPPSKNARRALERSGRRITRLLEKGTASKMRDELNGRIDPGVLEEINFLLPWRNLLAHRYLRQRMAGPGEKQLRVTPDMPFELAEISTAFAAAGDRVERERIRILSEMSKPGEVPPGLADAITLVMSELFFAKPPRFSRD